MKKIRIILVTAIIVLSINAVDGQNYWSEGTGGIYYNNSTIGLRTGVGTTTPLGGLHIATDEFTGLYMERTLNSNYTPHRVRMGISGSGVYLGLRIQVSGDGGSTWNNGLLVRSVNGYVGIGTLTPTAPLTVNGLIKAEEILVENLAAVNGTIRTGNLHISGSVPQSDHVFNSDYQLMTLAELDAFIKANKHLPEVPSAEEFKEEGYSVGEMDDLLLRKIEELTLYILEMEQKQIELEAKIEKIKEKN